MRLALCLLALLGLAACDAFSAVESVPFAPIEAGVRVQVDGTTVIRDRSAWETFWAQHSGPTPAPAVDFSRQTVVGVFYGGSFHAGCEARVRVVESVVRDGDALRVRVVPLPDLGPCRAVVHPFEVVAVDVSGTDAPAVRFVGRVP